jgi:protein Mpv17
MEQTLASQLGIVPLLYYPAFFSLTGAMQGLSVDQTLERARSNFLPLMQRNLAFWIPIQFIQFSYIDPDLQIPFLSACGLCWTIILSLAAGSASKYNKDVVERYTEEVMAESETAVPVLSASYNEA